MMYEMSSYAIPTVVVAYTYTRKRPKTDEVNSRYSHDNAPAEDSEKKVWQVGPQRVIYLRGRI